MNVKKDQMTYPNLERKLAERHVMKKDLADLLNEPDIRSLFQKRNG